MRDRVQSAFDLLSSGLAPFVERECRAAYGDEWLERATPPRVRERGGKVNPKDPQFLLKAMVDLWMTLFSKVLSRAERGIVGELLDFRNQHHHYDEVSPEDSLRCLDDVSRLLRAVSAPEADAAQALYEELRDEISAKGRKADKARKPKADALEGFAVANLRPWRDVVVPHPDVISGDYQKAEFAADLHQVHSGGGRAEYSDPVEFFRRTHITAGLERLLVESIKRLNGTGGAPVVALKTNFGGGKTHSLLALYHLFAGYGAETLRGVSDLVKKAGATFLPKANRAVLVGTALGPDQVQEKPDGTTVHTLWGELAWQLGGAEGYAIVADADRSATNPGDRLVALLREHGPCVILIDEWVAYARGLWNKEGLKGGDFATHFTFAQALTEAAKAVDDALLVVSIPASQRGDATIGSEVEIGGEAGHAALNQLTNVVDRVAEAWTPASSEEAFAIVRSRLFDEFTDETEAAREGTVLAFSKYYAKQKGEFPSETREAAYERRMRDAYPIHPELFDRLYEDWSTLERFQRTRGVLRLMATVVRALWMDQDPSPLIMPGSIPIDDQTVFNELTRYLPDSWKPVIHADVDGENSLPYRIDLAKPNLGARSRTRRVARTVYMGSAPTAGSPNRGIDVPTIRLGCVLPDEQSPAFVADALNHLSAKATYLYADGTRYWYAPVANVNSVAADRAARYAVEDLDEEIRKRLPDSAAGSAFTRVLRAPLESGDILDEPGARLVILHPEHAHQPKAATSTAIDAAKRFLEKRGEAGRRYRNGLVFLAPEAARLAELRPAVAELLAWTSILEDSDVNLDDQQRAVAGNRRQTAEDTVNLRIAETYSWLLVPKQAGPQDPITLESVRCSGSDGLVNRAAKRLTTDEALITTFGGSRLRMILDAWFWKAPDDPAHIEIRRVADALGQYVYMPRLRDDSVLREAIISGVDDSLGWEWDGFGYADLLDGDQPRGVKAKTRVSPDMVRGVLVHPRAVPAPAEPEAEVSGRNATSTAEAAGPGTVSTESPDVERRATRFHASVGLDPLTMGSAAGKIQAEIVQHLAGLLGAEVEITLEIHADIPEGVPNDIQRDISENARTLKFNHHAFEEE